MKVRTNVNLSDGRQRWPSGRVADIPDDLAAGWQALGYVTPVSDADEPAEREQAPKGKRTATVRAPRKADKED